MLTAPCFLGKHYVKLGTDAEQYGTSDFMLLMQADPWHSV